MRPLGVQHGECSAKRMEWNLCGFESTLAPGAGGSTTLTVTSPAGMPDGIYHVNISIINGSAATYSASGTAGYVISSPVAVTLAVSTDKTNYSSGPTVYVTPTVMAGTSPQSGATVNVTITKLNGSVVSQTVTIG